MFLSPRRLRILLALAFVAGVAQTARAQCTSTYASLEARICVARSVYHGSIAGYERTVIVSRGDTTIPDGVNHYVVKVKVSETFKGPARESVDLVMTTSDYDTRVDEWHRQKSTFLFFVADADKAEGRKPLDDKWPPPWTSLRLEHPVAGETGYSSIAPPIFARDASVLREPKEILAAARDFVRRHPNADKTHTFDIPRGTAELCSASCDANDLVVPIEPGLETTAKRMLSAPQEFVARETDPKWVPRYQLRRAGVDALRHFKSDENTALLKSLLDDPSSILSTYDFGKYKGKTVRRYEIRALAFEILKSWGEEVPEPVTVEVIPSAGQ